MSGAPLPAHPELRILQCIFVSFRVVTIPPGPFCVVLASSSPIVSSHLCPPPICTLIQQVCISPDITLLSCLYPHTIDCSFEMSSLSPNPLNLTNSCSSFKTHPVRLQHILPHGYNCLRLRSPMRTVSSRYPGHYFRVGTHHLRLD